MSLGDKQGLDAILSGWPALPASRKGSDAAEQDEEKVWEERADTIVKAALSRPKTGDEALDALIGPPVLPAEPGESGQSNLILLPSGGEKKMSQDKDGGSSGNPPERKRTSLKAIAERASQSGGRPSTPSNAGATPVPTATVTPLPGARQSRPSTPPAGRPSEAGKDDSGIVNLNVVRAAATPQQVAAADKAKPGTEGLFEDDKAEPAAAAPAAAASKPAAKAKPPEKSGNGAVIGIGIAILGLAAAFAITLKDKPKPPERAMTPVVAEVKAAPTAEANAAPPPAATATAVAEPTPSSTAEADKPADSPKVAAGPSGAGTGPAPAKDPDDGKVAQAPKVAPTAGGGKPGDLQSEMAKAVGADGQPKKGDGVPEPAAGVPRNQNIPEQPSQGAVQGAITAVMGGAKACVAGADDVSRAQVTFASNGSVTGVSVTGWAAAHGKSGCVQAALKGAKVGPFSKPSFTVGVPIRP